MAWGFSPQQSIGKASEHKPRHTLLSWKPCGQDVQPAHNDSTFFLVAKCRCHVRELADTFLTQRASIASCTTRHRSGDAPIPSLQPPGAQFSCWQLSQSEKTPVPMCVKA